RMLWQMASMLSAMRALMYTASVEGDLAKIDKSHLVRNELYTPIVKGWLTELALEITSTSVQVFGGMGFIEETGVAQLYRDARILPIYEGTNGIQALDLVGRKLKADKGAGMAALIEEISTDLASFTQLDGHVQALSLQVKLLQSSTELMLDQQVNVSEAAFDYMMQSGYVLGGWLLLKGAQDAAADEAWLAKKNFYFDHILLRANTAAESVKGFKSDQSIPNVTLLNK
ncbi:MAG: acyl-CoA dehydrogenase family protein, partial [Pseudomonadota bacterium]|nr:acyl-CoA dehydrogenase family protein [Pseudomonadota bacterium]